ncbi:MAG: gamma-glutamyl-gamma-aminobutyrate hydrolase family protein, partial [Rikenellaceae bacterium]
ALPIIFPLKASHEDIIQLCDMCDGFLFTGGEDVNPTIYGEAKRERCGVPNEDRDSMERVILDYAIANDKPLLGICRGIQIINALLGGTLYQDLPTEYDSEQNHQMDAPYDREWHRARITEDTPLAALSESLDIAVNSYHHQAIRTLAPTLKAMAISEDGLIEAIYMPTKSNIIAVQWHPELSFHTQELSRKIFALLLT